MKGVGQQMRLAGIVLYNPDLERLRLNITACAKQIDEIICIDNGSNNIGQIEKLIKELQEVKDTSRARFITLFQNDKNLGIAKALNQMLVYAKDNKYEWVLSLDQDSIILPGLLDRYEDIVNISERENREWFSGTLSMLTTVYKDRNSKLMPKTNGEFEEISECITSASYSNVETLLSVGGYDEKMFIDYVDYDICATLKEHGYSIVRLNYIGFIHEVGRAQTVNFWGVQTNVHNESAFRKYFQTRNHLYFIRKHRGSVNKWVEYRRVIKLFLLTVIYETGRKEKLKAMLKGIRDSRKMIYNNK